MNGRSDYVSHTFGCIAHFAPTLGIVYFAFDVSEFFFNGLANVLKGCWLALHGKSLCGRNGLGGRRPQNQVENKTEARKKTEDEKYYAHHNYIDAEVVGKSCTDTSNDLVVCVAIKAAAAVLGF